MRAWRALLASGLFLLPSAPLVAQTPVTWEAIGRTPGGTGISGRIHGMAPAPGVLYAVGDFGFADGQAVNRVARWDGAGWHPVGGGVSGGGFVPSTALVAPNGDLYVAGSFTTAGTVPARGVARWDGAAWHGLSLPDGPVTPSVGVLALAPDGTLYAGGSRPTSSGAPVRSAVVLRWSGSAWDEIAVGHPPSGTPPGGGVMVRALAVAPDGALYAGGSFTTLGGVPAAGLARYDGAAWTALPSAGGTQVSALALAPDGSLYAAANVAGLVRRWDGGAWHTLGEGLVSSQGFGAYVNELVVASDGSLYAGGGSFDRAGGVATRNVARWDGAAWHGLDGGIPEQTFDEVLALAVAPGGVYVGGEFGRAGGIVAPNAAHWDGAAWRSLGGPGTDGAVRALASAEGGLVAGGEFGVIGGALARGIGWFDGAGWLSLGGALDGDVSAVARAPNGDLYVAGSFTTAGTVSARGVARWDGAAWHALGTGILGSVYALAVASDGTLYAAGGFGTAGGVDVNRIARWSGSAWSAMGTGIGGSSGVIVWALAAMPDGSLYAGGDFTYAGGTVSPNLARWDGTAWQPMPSTPASVAGAEVFALATAPDGALLVGGQFDGNVGRLAGSAWSTVGGGTDAAVRALAFDADGRLYAGGNFTTAGGVPANRVAYHDGSAWHAVGAGIAGGTVHALATAPGGVLYAGGSFTTAGGAPAPYVARATGLPVRDEDVPTGPSLAAGVWPNPATGAWTVRFSLPSAQAVRVTVVDVLGREVRTLLDGTAPAGPNALSVPTPLPAGVYVVRVSAESATVSSRFTVIR